MPKFKNYQLGNNLSNKKNLAFWKCFLKFIFLYKSYYQILKYVCHNFSLIAHFGIFIFRKFSTIKIF